MTLFTKGRAATVAAFAALAIVTAACSSDDASEPAASDGGVASTMPSAADAMSGTFGAGCAAVPESGAGSFDGMAMDPVATAASNNPALSTLVTAVTKAKLVDTLNGAEDITVFAPTDDAFAAMDADTLAAALDDPKGLLTTVLTYHVVAGRLSPEGLAGTHETLEGDTLEVTGSGEDFTVNGDAAVVCGNVQTANATVYLIDGVLLPPQG
jgi:uncharacterized surface protein with fasciclin (FAS1) repeats